MTKDGIVFGSIGAVDTVVRVSHANGVVPSMQFIGSAPGGAGALAYTIWRWYKNAKKDGKITEDEVDDLFEQITKKEDSEDEHRD